MQTAGSAEVVVQREWDGWRTATTRIDDLENVHWFRPPRAPRAMIHAYVPCTKLQSGDLPHDCADSPAPHRLLVCVLKSHTAPPVFEELMRRADQRSGQRTTALVSGVVAHDPIVLRGRQAPVIRTV